jgi:N-hydroxyarylamine O-acetyltransferase
VEVEALLRRIGYDGPVQATAAVLRRLHRAWVQTVPFENLDIHLGRTIALSEAHFFDKISLRRRGGWCFEMNGLFAALLRAIGFDVTLLSARVFNDQGEAGREFVHLCLVVTAPSGGSRWLSDVGFGDSFSEALRFEPRLEQQIDDQRYRIENDGDDCIFQRRTSEGWQSRYAFTLIPRTLSDFAGMCHDLQTNPESHFVKRAMCTRHTPSGRVTLAGNRLITTSCEARRETVVPDGDAYAAALRDGFGIVLDEDEIARLWARSH